MSDVKLPIDEDRVLGLIPARGGSKSIPLKNIADLAGQPMIAYVIAAGVASRRLDRIICSTDHPSIAEAERLREAWEQANFDSFRARRRRSGNGAS